MVYPVVSWRFIDVGVFLLRVLWVVETTVAVLLGLAVFLAVPCGNSGATDELQGTQTRVFCFEEMEMPSGEGGRGPLREETCECRGGASLVFSLKESFLPSPCGVVCGACCACVFVLA